jgi:hypothetical protein
VTGQTDNRDVIARSGIGGGGLACTKALRAETGPVPLLDETQAVALCLADGGAYSREPDDWAVVWRNVLHHRPEPVTPELIRRRLTETPMRGPGAPPFTPAEVAEITAALVAELDARAVRAARPAPAVVAALDRLAGHRP